MRGSTSSKEPHVESFHVYLRNTWQVDEISSGICFRYSGWILLFWFDLAESRKVNDLKAIQHSPVHYYYLQNDTPWPFDKHI